MTSFNTAGGTPTRASLANDGAKAAKSNTHPSSGWLDAVHESLHGDGGAIAGDTGQQAPHPRADASTSHVVRPGETLGELSARYAVPASDILRANPAIRDPNAIRAGQTLTVPLAKAGGRLPGLHIVRPGDTLSRIAARHDSSPSRLAAANNVDDPDEIRAGDQIWIPKAGGRVHPAAPAANHAMTAKPTSAGAASGHSSSSPEAVDGGLRLPNAPAELPGAAGGPGAGPPQRDAASQMGASLQAQAIVAGAQSQSDPVKALQALNAGIAKAPQSMRDAVLANPATAEMIDDAARWANEPLSGPTDGMERAPGKMKQVIQRLDQVTQGMDKILAGTVANRAALGYEAYATDPRNSDPSPPGPERVTALMKLCGRIAGTAQGDEAVARFADTGVWNRDAIRNAIVDGADPAYAIALARRLQASGQNGAGVLTLATQGMQQFKDKIAGDVGKLAEHDAELSWMVQNLGPGLPLQQLQQAVADYRSQKGDGWQQEEAGLSRQVADDGSKLTRQMIALNEASPKLSGSQAAVDGALRTVANDPAAGLAISAAIRSDPQLTREGAAPKLADVFELAKVGDIGKRFTNEAASAFMRDTVSSKLRGLDLRDPASVAAAKQAIHNLGSGTFARLAGVTPSDTKKAVDALEQAVNQAGDTPEEAYAALQQFNNTLETDASLSKTFNKTTFPGQLLRGVGVAFAGVGLVNSTQKFNADPSDPQNGIRLLVDAAGFAQRNAELLVGLGQIGKGSAVGQFGGEWSLAGRASAGDLIAGISVVLDGVSAVRAGFGIGTQQDRGNAAFFATSAAGGGMTLAPAFGAGAWLGPAGLTMTVVGVVGRGVYQAHKEAHQYEAASSGFLRSAGYGDAAATALSKQGDLLSGVGGSSPMPFLAKYAELKRLSPTQIRTWVNGLTADQVNTLSTCLLRAVKDSNGNPEHFTAGPPHTMAVGGPHHSITNKRNDSLEAFESSLNSGHVPHP